MNLPKCMLKNTKRSLRWKNWEDFLKDERRIRHTRKNKTAIICLYYSSIENVKWLFDYISKDKYHEDFDLILINNSSKYDIDFSKQFKNDNIIILSPLVNLWTDGWYALWIEYCIKNDYEYLFIVEDDVLFLDDWVFSEIYESMDEKSVGFLSHMINNEEFKHSRYVQIACYPVSFLKKTWIMDPRFFTRWWEYKWIFFMEDIIKKYWYKKNIINKRHFHPYLKKNNRSAWWIYFSWRNVFRNMRRCDFVQLEVIFFMYIRTGFSKLLLEWSYSYVKALLYAVKDFIVNDRSIDTSLDRMHMISKYKQPVPKHIEEITVEYGKVSDYTKWLFNFDWLWVRWFTSYDAKKIQWSSKISAFFKNWVVIPNINCPLYPIAILSKKIVAVNEFDIFKNIADISIIKAKFRFKITKTIISLIFSTIVYIIVIIPIKIKVLIRWLMERSEY